MVRSPRVSRVLPLALLFAATTLVAERQARPPQPPTPQSGAEGELAKINAELVAMQVALDRVHFSPGEIDGQAGDNTMRALAAFRAAHGVTAPRPTTETPVGTAGRSARGTKAGPAAPPAPVLDPATRDALAPWIDQPLTDYTIGEPDVAGPFTTVPADLMEQSKLDVLGYTSPLELLAERFHAAPALIRALNPDAQYVAGETLRVPNVDPMLLPTTQGPVAGKDDPNNPTVIEVSEADRLLRLRRGDELLLVAPVTVGSEHDPLPVGDWVVTDVFLNPIFNYNPELFWDADRSHAEARIAAGPNNPVGPVWVDIDKEHFGLHGAPSPNAVGHTQSHGCVRLTNWDALTLAGIVRKGTKVVLR